MKAAVAWLVVLLLLLAGYAYKTDPKLASSCVGPAPSAMVVSSRVLRRMGELVNADPHPPAAIKHDVDRVLRIIRLLWWSLSQPANGQKIDPQIVQLEKADDERRRKAPLCSAALAEDEPCPQSPKAPEAAEPFDPKLASLRSSTTGTAGQRRITATTVRVAQQMGVPARGWVVAITAGLTESELRNLNYGHSSSVGVWQLIDSHGTVAQRMNVAWSARWFFRQLKAVDGWQSMPVGQAAQAVERSAFPGRYASREAEARRLLASVGTAPAPEAPTSCSPTTPPGPATDSRLAALSNRRTPAQAVAYMRAMARTQASDGSGRCLHFVGMAYGYPTTADYYAIDQWRNAPAKYRHTSANPPAGALMFWDTGKVAGHVAISLGGGLVASTDTGLRGGVGIHPVSYFRGYGQFVGWTDPYFRNQTSEGAKA